MQKICLQLSLESNMARQTHKLKFQEKTLKDQKKLIKEQKERIEESIRQQQDPRHNQWQQRYGMVSEEEKKRLWLKCRTKGCKYTGPVLHFAFIYETTLCPKCASKKVFAKGMASTYSRRQASMSISHLQAFLVLSRFAKAFFIL